MTKRTYTKQMNDLQAALDANQIAQNAPMTDAEYNALYDAEYAILEAIQSLEWDWTHRNTTQAEYNTLNLVCQNID